MPLCLFVKELHAPLKTKQFNLLSLDPFSHMHWANKLLCSDEFKSPSHHLWLYTHWTLLKGVQLMCHYLSAPSFSSVSYLFMQCLLVKCHICYINAQLSCVFTLLSNFFEAEESTAMTNIYLRHERSVKIASSGFIPQQSQPTNVSVPSRTGPDRKRAMQ